MFGQTSRRMKGQRVSPAELGAVGTVPRRGMPRGPGPAALCGAGGPQPGAGQSRRCATRTRTRTRSRAAGLRRRLYPAVYAGSRRRQQSPMAGCFPRAAEVAVSTNPPPSPEAGREEGDPRAPTAAAPEVLPGRREGGRSGEQGRRPHGRAPRPSPSAAPTWRAPGGPAGGQRPCPSPLHCRCGAASPSRARRVGAGDAPGPPDL